MLTPYEQRLRISIVGDPTKKLFTKSGEHLATGYERIVIGGRGPYVEFDLGQLNPESLKEVDIPHFYYRELRSCVDDVKVYVQLQRVDYADYCPGKCYVSPFELYDVVGTSQLVVLIQPLR